MRIAVATDIYLPQLSGVADSIDLLARTLLARGHTVQIYAPDVPGATPDARVLRRPAWSVPGSGGGLMLVSPFGLPAGLRRFRPDIVHAHTFSTVGLAAAAAARRLRIPLVGTDHTFPADYLHYLRLDYRPFRNTVRRLSALYYNRCAFVTGPSRSILTELRAYGLSRPSGVISNPIPGDLFHPLDGRAELRARLGLRGRAILIFGRIAVEKNLGLALDVVARVAAETEAELVVIGDGPYRSAFEARAAALGLGDRTRMLGVLRGAPLVEAINACDAFLTTSLSETQSMAMLQAMACALPVVAVEAGGLGEYVHDGISGFLVDPADPRGLARRLLELLGDAERARAMGRAAAQTARRFDPGAITARFEKVYASVAAGRATHLQDELDGEAV
jgi:1,2-diacylglycerol 3-alpha-glucosyltransferase